jgi:hypothetical protein
MPTYGLQIQYLSILSQLLRERAAGPERVDQLVPFNSFSVATLNARSPETAFTVYLSILSQLLQGTFSPPRVAAIASLSILSQLLQPTPQPICDNNSAAAVFQFFLSCYLGSPPTQPRLPPPPPFNSFSVATGVRVFRDVSAVSLLPFNSFSVAT